MDDRILFQVIEGSIRDGMRDGFNGLDDYLPTREDQFTMAALTGLCANPNLMSKTAFVEIAEGTRGGKHFILAARALATAMKEREK